MRRHAVADESVAVVLRAPLRRARRCRSSRARCSAASTRAGSMRSRCTRCFRASSRPSGRTAASCARSAGRNPSAARHGAFRSLTSGMGELVSAIGRRLPPGSVRLATAGAHAHPYAVTAGGSTTPHGDVDAPARDPRCARLRRGAPARPLDREASALCAGCHTSRPPASRSPIRASGGASAAGLRLRRVARRHRRRAITACTWVSSKWAGRAPEGRVLLRAFIGGAHDSSAVDLRTTRAGGARDARTRAGARPLRDADAHAASIAGATPARSTTSATSRGVARLERAPRGACRAARRRQRLPRDRHSRLRRRRARRGGGRRGDRRGSPRSGLTTAGASLSLSA